MIAIYRLYSTETGRALAFREAGQVEKVLEEAKCNSYPSLKGSYVAGLESVGAYLDSRNKCRINVLANGPSVVHIQFEGVDEEVARVKDGLSKLLVPKKIELK